MQKRKRKWEGFFLDGKTAARTKVTLYIAPGGIDIRLPRRKKMLWPYAEINQTQGFHRTSHIHLERLKKESGVYETLVILEHSFLEALHEAWPKVARRWHHPRERLHRQLLLPVIVVMVIVSGFGVYLWGIPYAAKFVALKVPAAWERQLGYKVTENILEGVELCKDEALVSAVDYVMQPLIHAAPKNPYTFEIRIAKEGTVNAVAAPGGVIVLYTGLLEKAESPEELAGVLAHEMQHVLERHGTQSIFRDLALSLLFKTGLGDIGGIMSGVMEGATTVASLGYSRKEEWEADEKGLLLLKEAGINPAGMISIFEKFQEEEVGEDLPEFLSTHPVTKNRIAKMEELKKDGRYQRIRLPEGIPWSTVKLRCSPSVEETR